MSETFDTSMEVADAMYEYGQQHDMHRLRLSPREDTLREAQAAIAADRQALAQAGLVIVGRAELVALVEEFVSQMENEHGSFNDLDSQYQDLVKPFMEIVENGQT